MSYSCADLVICNTKTINLPGTLFLSKYIHNNRNTNIVISPAEPVMPILDDIICSENNVTICFDDPDSISLERINNIIEMCDEIRLYQTKI